MLYDSLLRQNHDSLQKGLDSLDAWVGALLPSGLLCVHYEALLDNSDLRMLLIDSCNLGNSAENFIEAWELAKECGAEKPEYLRVAKSILDISMASQREDGAYPSAFMADGVVASFEGTTGGFLMPAMLWMFAATRETIYRTSAEKAFAYYYQEFRNCGYTMAGALDTHCIDKESAIPLLSTSLMLYKATKDTDYLDAAVKAAYYLSTWQWHHSVEYPEGSALHDMEYDTFGGTAVSTQHHHIDGYALRYMPYLQELANLTGNELWRQRAEAIWNNATIGISDGTLEVMGLRRPRGSQDEGFMHTRWGSPFNVSQWLVAWPTAFRLEVLRKTRFFSRNGLGDGIRI